MVAVENFDQKQQRVEVSPDFSLHKYGFARPEDVAPSSVDLPFRYPWKETYEALQKLAATPGDPYDGVHLRYVNPRSLGPAVHTIGCEIQMLRPNEKTKSHRHTASAIYHAFRGSGRTIVGDKVLEWDEGDIFTVPLWSWHRHENQTNHEAVLFSINDRPAKEALGFYREEKEAE
jgi:gentisate 1,2-dioxygenase